MIIGLAPGSFPYELTPRNLPLSTVMRASYSHHYRRAIPALLQALEFRSNNQMHQPVIRALDVIKQTVAHAPRFYDPEEVPLEGVVSSGWRELILMPDKQGHLRVDRLKYELCVLEVLRERLRCKEIWVVGANRYRNPDEDLPTDFEVQREQYYAALNLPQDVENFRGGVQREMSEALTLLDRSLPKNPLLDLRDTTLCVGYDGSGGAFDAILRCSPNSSENGHIRHCRAQALYEIAGVLLCQRRRGGNTNLRRIVSARGMKILRS